ncbi:cell division ATP-binding protein FtsE [Rubrivirga sp.]|uniref:cell division ATP-binding protein FtsE n=1 Tax=Rubrivirga sp. TaxID=1885344 RepID=UPI003C793758
MEPVVERVSDAAPQPTPRERPLVELRNVAAGYTDPSGARVDVATDLNLTLKRGEMAYLIGPTGSGKSTLLKLLYMDVKPEYGVVRVGPYQSDATKERDIPHLRRMLGVVFQDFKLLPDRSAVENVSFALHATGKRGKVVRQKALQALAEVGLSHRAKARPSEMSGGEQQRACIARALVNDPVLLLADEPTGNLDPRVADEIQGLLVKVHRQGMALLMATHDYRLVKAFPARTLALVRGRLVEVDPDSL